MYETTPQQPHTYESAEHMAKLNGEYELNGITAGWHIQERVPGQPSQDTAYIGATDSGQIFLGVFDGMGGAGGGEVAANIAADRLHAETKDDPAVNIENFSNDVLGDINDEINKSPEVAPGGGTTALIAAIDTSVDGERFLDWASVGDSLGFLIRGGEISQINPEHSHVANLLASGHDYDQEVLDSVGHIITKNLGGDSYKNDAYTGRIPLDEGDVIVFTSDGITGDKSTQRMRGESNEAVIIEIAQDPRLTDRQKAQKMVSLATKIDDRTALVVTVQSLSSESVTGDRVDRIVSRYAELDHLSEDITLDTLDLASPIDRFKEETGRDVGDTVPTLLNSGKLDVVGWTIHSFDVENGKVRISKPNDPVPFADTLIYNHPVDDFIDVIKQYDIDVPVDSPQRLEAARLDEMNSSIATKMEAKAIQFGMKDDGQSYSIIMYSKARKNLNAEDGSTNLPTEGLLSPRHTMDTAVKNSRVSEDQLAELADLYEQIVDNQEEIRRLRAV